MAIAAFFDVDGTLTRTTILDPLVWYQRARLSQPRFALWAAGVLLEIPYYLVIDRHSRAWFTRVFYRRYSGLSAADLSVWQRESFTQRLRSRLIPAVLDCLLEHQGQGHRIVLVTGALDHVMRPLAEFLQVDELIAHHLVECNGTFTGELREPPIAEERKAALVRGYADRNDIDLGQSFAYGDSIGDVPMLECVGHPVAVNPDRRLRRLATGYGWRLVEWRTAR